MASLKGDRRGYTLKLQWQRGEAEKIFLLPSELEGRQYVCIYSRFWPGRTGFTWKQESSLRVLKRISHKHSDSSFLEYIIWKAYLSPYLALLKSESIIWFCKIAGGHEDSRCLDRVTFRVKGHHWGTAHFVCQHNPKLYLKGWDPLQCKHSRQRLQRSALQSSRNVSCRSPVAHSLKATPARSPPSLLQGNWEQSTCPATCPPNSPPLVLQPPALGSQAAPYAKGAIASNLIRRSLQTGGAIGSRWLTQVNASASSDRKAT